MSDSNSVEEVSPEQRADSSSNDSKLSEERKAELIMLLAQLVLQNPTELPETTLERGQRMLEYARELDDESWLAASYLKIGHGFLRSSRNSEVLDWSGKAIELYKKLQDLPGMIRARNVQEAALSHLGNPADYYSSLLETLSLARKTKDPNLVCRSLLAVSNGANLLHNSKIAIEYLLECLALAHKNKLQPQIQNTLYGLAQVSKANNEYQVALHYIEEAISIDTLSSAGWRARLLSECSQIHTLLGHQREALEIAKEAIKLTLETQDANAKSIAHRILSEALFASANYPEAREQAKAAAKTAKETNQVRQYGAALCTLGKIEVAGGHWADAIKSLTEALEISEKLQSADLKCQINEYFSLAYEHAADFSNALKYKKLHMEAHEQHQKEETRLQLQSMEIELGIEKERQEARITAVRLEHVETELTSRIQLFVGQTDLLASLREDLRKILRRIEVKDPAINELYAWAKKLPEGVNWKEFEEQFQKVHPGFRKNLSKKHPELTKMELQICALLRLNLNSADIGKLLSIAQRSVENHRHRLRKKIGLGAKEDIAKHLAQF